MKKINIKGRIIGNGFSCFVYDLFKIPYASPNSVISQLDEANGEDIEIHINSGGGSVYDGYEIYNAISEYEGNVTIKIVGLAASAASYIAMARNAKLLMSPLSEMMIHNAACGAQGQHTVMSKTSEMLQVTDHTISNAYTMKSGRSEEEIRAIMEEETWLSANRCKELGLIDGIMFENDVKEPAMAPTLYNAIDDVFMSDLEGCRDIKEVEEKVIENIRKMFKSSMSSEPIKINELSGNKEENSMNLDELKAKHPDLYNQIVNETKQNATNEAVTAERERIKAINALQCPGAEKQIEEGIQNGLNAGEVAINILKANKTNGANVFSAMVEDAQNSGMGGVADVAAPQNHKTDEEVLQDEANAIASFMNGGKR